MHPHSYFGLFPPFPREEKVFVAMSFDEPFRVRWNQVIIPAVQAVRVNGLPLQPHRVDVRRMSDSILTGILGGIANDRVIFADVTTLGQLDSKPMRNGNVMYEIGLAHAVRLPEEVILFRSDADPLLFDVANVRVNTYDPDHDPDAARTKVSEAILEALREVDLKRQLAVKAAAETLDFVCWSVLWQTLANGSIQHFLTRGISQTLAYIAQRQGNCSRVQDSREELFSAKRDECTNAITRVCLCPNGTPIRQYDTK